MGHTQRAALSREGVIQPKFDWIFATHGILRTNNTDKGPPFNSAELADFIKPRPRGGPADWATQFLFTPGLRPGEAIPAMS